MEIFSKTFEYVTTCLWWRARLFRTFFTEKFCQGYILFILCNWVIYKLFEQCKVKDIIFWLVSFNRFLILNKLPAKLFVLLRFVSCSFHLSVGLLLTLPLKNKKFWYFFDLANKKVLNFFYDFQNKNILSSQR